MGQLERYGLYVLVVVIFLILGVAIWGGDPAAPRERLAVTSDTSAGVEQNGVKMDVLELFGGDPRDRFTEPPKTEAERTVAGAPQFIAADGTTRRQFRSEPESRQLDPAPEPPVRRTHVVKAGETMSSISRSHYGNPNEWKRIADANPGVDPNKMPQGTTLVIPDRAVEATAGRVDSGQPSEGSGTDVIHVVKDGEVMGSIAKRFYGSANDWRLIADANPSIDPRKMPAGTRLRIPPKD